MSKCHNVVRLSRSVPGYIRDGRRTGSYGGSTNWRNSAQGTIPFAVHIVKFGADASDGLYSKICLSKVKRSDI